MKRSAISRGAPVDAEGRRRFSTFNQSGGSIPRTPMVRKLPRRLERRAHLNAHGDFVRTQPCCSCGRVATEDAPNAAAHITLSRNQKGMAMKVPDEQRVALCDSDVEAGTQGCHPQWDQHRGKFDGWTDEQRYEIGMCWVATTLARWEAHQLSALLPKDEALAS